MSYKSLNIVKCILVFGNTQNQWTEDKIDSSGCCNFAFPSHSNKRSRYSNVRFTLCVFHHVLLLNDDYYRFNFVIQSLVLYTLRFPLSHEPQTLHTDSLLDLNKSQNYNTTTLIDVTTLLRKCPPTRDGSGEICSDVGWDCSLCDMKIYFIKTFFTVQYHWSKVSDLDQAFSISFVYFMITPERLDQLSLLFCINFSFP